MLLVFLEGPDGWDGSSKHTLADSNTRDARVGHVTLSMVGAKVTEVMVVHNVMLSQIFAYVMYFAIYLKE